MRPHSVHDVLERLSTVLRASLRESASAHGLKLVQLEALIYLGRANRYSNTPVALTEYLGTTKGTVSQTLIALERRGLIEKVADERDGRVVRCVLTPAADRILADAYPAPVLQALDDEQAAETGAALAGLLTELQAARGNRSFGICHTCAHFGPRSRGGVCRLTGERLTTLDTRRLCREHQAAGAAR